MVVEVDFVPVNEQVLLEASLPLELGLAVPAGEDTVL